MTKLTRGEAHLLLAGIRVLSHLADRPPTPAQLAELLEASESAVRLQLAVLQDVGAISLVESAFETHAEVADYSAVEQFDVEAGPEISEDLRAFDQKKREEAEKMSHLFESGEHEKDRQDKIDRMGDELDEFRKKKPLNPFGDD